MKTNYNIEIQRRNVTPAQFLAYVRRRLKATGGDAFCGCLDLDYFAAGSEPNYDTERDGTHCISHSKPYSMQTYIRQDGRLYNEICEFEFDDEKTGHGYYYLIDAEEETAETDTDTTDTPDTAETTERAEKENTMKTYEITFSNGNDIYSANLVIAESAEQATAYYTAKGREVIGCDETMSRPKPGQPVVTVPEGWTAPAAEPETTETTETAETAERAEAPEIIARMVEIIIAAPARSAWARGVRAYAAGLCGNLRRAATYAAETGTPSPLTDRETVRAALLNGARDWSEYSWGGCALIHDGHIAARVCTPSELRRTHGGEKRPNAREDWLDVQARALYQACAVLVAAYDTAAREGARV